MQTPNGALHADAKGDSAEQRPFGLAIKPFANTNYVGACCMCNLFTQSVLRDI